jgi:hypothetical protein
MDLYLLAELKTISLKITTVDMKRPPADFRYICSMYTVQPLLCPKSKVLFKSEGLLWTNSFLCHPFFQFVVWLCSPPSDWLASCWL